MFPVMLNLLRQPVLLVGSGRVARQKLAQLLAARASVRVVTVEAKPVDPIDAVWITATYDASHLDDMRLVFAAATPEVNRKVVADATVRGLWVNSASEPDLGTMTLPAVLRRGEFTVALSTGGASPAFTKAVRDRCEALFDPALGDFVAHLKRERHRIFKDIADPVERRRQLTAMATWDAYERYLAQQISSTS